jgi:hypothetical protein
MKNTGNNIIQQNNIALCFIILIKNVPAPAPITKNNIIET